MKSIPLPHPETLTLDINFRLHLGWGPHLTHILSLVKSVKRFSFHTPPHMRDLWNPLPKTNSISWENESILWGCDCAGIFM